MHIRDFETSLASTGEGNLEGRVLEWDKVYTFNGVKEKFAKNCDVNFKDTRCLFGHDKNKLLGRVGANLQVYKKEDGLYFKLKKSATDLFKNVYTLAREGILKGVSPGFDSDARWDGDIRVFDKVDLSEISLVGQPAYGDSTFVTARDKETINYPPEVYL